jgi:hypothetical protein
MIAAQAAGRVGKRGFGANTYTAVVGGLDDGLVLVWGPLGKGGGLTGRSLRLWEAVEQADGEVEPVAVHWTCGDVLCVLRVKSVWVVVVVKGGGRRRE